MLPIGLFFGFFIMVALPVWEYAGYEWAKKMLDSITSIGNLRVIFAALRGAVFGGETGAYAAAFAGYAG